MATLSFSGKKKGENIGHAEMNHHTEQDLEDLKKKVGPKPSLKISNRLEYFVWAGMPLDPDGTISWLALLRALTRELALLYFFFVIVLTTAGYLAPLPDTVGNALAFATVTAMSAIGFVTWRHTRMLPTQLNYALTFAEMFHFRIGPIMQLFYIAVGIAATFLAAVTVSGLVTVPVGPNWTAGAAGAFSTGGAIIYYLLAGFLFVLAYQHNQTLDLHTYYNKSESTNLLNVLRLAFQVGGVTFATAFVGWFTGMWDANPFMSVAACYSAGTCNAPISGAWAVRFFIPIVGGLLGWAVHLWTWDQNSVDPRLLREAAKQQAAAQYGFYDGRVDRSGKNGRKLDHA